jgi:hypothetical protein
MRKLIAVREDCAYTLPLEANNWSLRTVGYPHGSADYVSCDGDVSLSF